MPCTDMVMGHQSLERGWGVLCRDPHAQPGQDRRRDQDFPGGLAGVSGFLRGTILEGRGTPSQTAILRMGLTMASKQTHLLAPMKPSLSFYGKLSPRPVRWWFFSE